MGEIREVGSRIELWGSQVELEFYDHRLSKESVRKWMRLAKTVKEVESPCYSRQIGVVIVDPNTNSLVSSGHNGPPEGL